MKSKNQITTICVCNTIASVQLFSCKKDNSTSTAVNKEILSHFKGRFFYWNRLFIFQFYIVQSI